MSALQLPRVVILEKSEMRTHAPIKKEVEAFVQFLQLFLNAISRFLHVLKPPWGNSVNASGSGAGTFSAELHAERMALGK